MSEENSKSKADGVYENAGMTECVYTNKTFEKRESNGISSEGIQIETETVNTDQITQPQPTGISYPVMTFRNAEKEKTNRKKRPYVRLDCNTYANEIPKLHKDWNVDEPEVLISVLSDSYSSTAKGLEVIESMSNGSVQNICRSLVTAAATTDAWLITGGLNKGIDHLIGSEVRQRMANRDKIPLAVLGITDWERLSEKKDLLKETHGWISIPTEMSLNQHNTHFLLVENGPQMDSSDSECRLRQTIEMALRKSDPSAAEKDPSRPLVYILIGGSVNAFIFVKHALANRIPVIIATETGGAADIICGTVESKDGAALDYLPEIVERLFHRLEELLVTDGTCGTKAREAIASIAAGTKLEPFFEIIELLDKTTFPEEVEEQCRNNISNLGAKVTTELLAKIKALVSSRRIPFDSRSKTADVSTESHTVDRMRALFEQMLVVNGIPKESAQKAVADLEPDLLEDTLTKVNIANSNLKAIKAQTQSNLLIKFDIEGSQKKSITSVIIEVLKKQKSTKPSDVFMLAVDWDDEKFFRQLLLDKWMWQEHEDVFMKLLDKDKHKYVKLMMEHNSTSKWLTRPQEPLKKEFSKVKLCEDLLKKIKDPESKTGNRIMGKVLFIWCIWRQMHDTAMLFWKQGQDCLAMTLIGYQESRKQKKALADKEGYEQMRRQMKVFSRHTIHFVGKCYENNHKYTHDLLIGKVRDLDNRTPLQIAVDADFKAFVSEVSVQSLLNKIWIKDVESQSDYKYAPMLISEACPFLAPVLLNIPDDKNTGKEKRKPVNRHTSVCKYFSKVRSFIDIPLVKFSYAFISLIAYLILFSIVLLTNFVPKMCAAEIALTIWTFILIIEEVKQAIVDIREYKGNKWNNMDAAALIMYIIGFILRMIYQGDATICPDCLYVARIVLAFSLMIFFFRTLQFLSVYESLGPKIFMIYQLVADLVSFLLILTVFISAYGVVSNVIMYPNQPLNAQLLKEVFSNAYWSVIQQFNSDEISGSKCDEDVKDSPLPEYCSSTSNADINYTMCKKMMCPANTWIVPVLLAIYSLITCVMLLNVLIAIFNSTFTNISEEQTEVSRMQRYLLIREFSSRSMIPPPLSVLTYPYFIFQELRRRHKARRFRSPSKAIDRSQANIENEEPSLNENEDFEDEQIVKKPGQAASQPNAFEKDLNSAVKDWEHHVVADYYKENTEKKGWYVARLESETEKSNNFDETPFMQIRYPSDS